MTIVWPWIPAVAGMTIVGAPPPTVVCECAAGRPSSFPWRREPIAGPPPWIPAVAGMTIPAVVGMTMWGRGFPPSEGMTMWGRGFRCAGAPPPLPTVVCECTAGRPIVVPVETGTHRRPPAVDSRRRGNDNVGPWIPAVVGMTMWGRGFPPPNDDVGPWIRAVGGNDDCGCAAAHRRSRGDGNPSPAPRRGFPPSRECGAVDSRCCGNDDCAIPITRPSDAAP